MSGWITALDRSFPRLAFARHLSPENILWRIALRTRTWLRRVTRMAPAMARLAPDTVLRPLGGLPLPVMPLRHHALSCDGNSWSFTLLNRTVVMPDGIDWMAPSMAPHDQLWRMTLHYMEYLETLPPTSGAEAIRQWIIANPASRAGAASDGWNSYALSIRLVCWLQWLARHDGSAAAQAVRPAMARSMAEQIAYLLCHLERDIGGNHLIKNIKALAWSAAAFDGPDCAHWLAKAQQLLAAELERQILADGVHYERSPAYHCQVAADLIEIAHVLPADDRSALRPVVDAMVRAAHALSHPDGQVAQFNDCGLTMAYRADDLSIGASAVGVADGGDRQSMALRSAGLLAWHNGSDSCIIKMGAIAPDRLPAHGHGDIGSFELSIAGQRCIVDQGVFEYVAGPARAHARSCAAHNVSQVGTWDQADFFGAFRIGWRTRGTPTMALDNDGRASATVTHDAFERPGGAGRMHRSVAIQPGRLLITDQVDNASDLPVISRLLIHPSWSVTVEGTRAVLRCQGRQLNLVASFCLRCEAAEWWPDMGKSLATSRLVMLWPPGATAMTHQFDWHDSTSQ